MKDFFKEWLAQDIPFSFRAFGEGMRSKGIREHVRRELVEIEKDPNDPEEWADVVILGLDGLWRCLYYGTYTKNFPYPPPSPSGPDCWDVTRLSELIAVILRSKLEKNERRKWPAPQGQDTPVEHDRTADPEPEPREVADDDTEGDLLL